MHTIPMAWIEPLWPPSAPTPLHTDMAGTGQTVPAKRDCRGKKKKKKKKKKKPGGKQEY
eukprot:NODE_28379_length_479_cov_1.170455.p3 GENE.NODE_28379_length_479_cov_1.170455~~NODE_28379_length_479_cov_1.170455.p3  ORF type:complete len:59 (+),score=22.75 NODE_28379_length_479_cov_1.170455:165-341(+)